MNYIDPKIKSVELQTIKRGSYKVVYTWKNNKVGSVSFSTKKDAQYYYDWITGNPKHNLHKINKELGF